jgi:hypothetical protein
MVYVLLIVFGAGASYDSVLHCPPPALQFSTNSLRVNQFGQHEEFRPPLANQLFEDRPLFVEKMEQYPACKPLVNLLRGDARVEQRLAKFEEDAKTFPHGDDNLPRSDTTFARCFGAPKVTGPANTEASRIT